MLNIKNEKIRSRAILHMTQSFGKKREQKENFFGQTERIRVKLFFVTFYLYFSSKIDDL